MNARTAPPEKAVPIKMENCSLDEANDKIVLRGVIAQESLRHLLCDEYQREAAPLTALSSIVDALEKGETLPDIELGLRGNKWRDKEDGSASLIDPVYIIDGQQRRNGALHFMSQHASANVRLGAMVHLGTTKEWETERFRVLNLLRNKVSPNVILRNMKEDSPAIGTLYSLSMSDKGFVLNERIAWDQRMKRGELLSAIGFAKIVGRLLSHKAPTKRTKMDELVPALDKSVEIFGVNNLRATVREFFALVNECWDLRNIQYREGAAYIKGNFLGVFAQFISDHHDFWRQPDERVLLIEPSLRRKIAQFPVHDPNVMNLAGSAGKARDMLYMLMRDHVNSGKRTRRLRSRNGDLVSFENGDEDEKE